MSIVLLTLSSPPCVFGFCLLYAGKSASLLLTAARASTLPTVCPCLHLPLELYWWWTLMNFYWCVWIELLSPCELWQDYVADMGLANSIPVHTEAQADAIHPHEWQLTVLAGDQESGPAELVPERQTRSGLLYWIRDHGKGWTKCWTVIRKTWWFNTQTESTWWCPPSPPVALSMHWSNPFSHTVQLASLICNPLKQSSKKKKVTHITTPASKIIGLLHQT